MIWMSFYGGTWQGVSPCFTFKDLLLLFFPPDVPFLQVRCDLLYIFVTCTISEVKTEYLKTRWSRVGNDQKDLAFLNLRLEAILHQEDRNKLGLSTSFQIHKNPVHLHWIASWWDQLPPILSVERKSLDSLHHCSDAVVELNNGSKIVTLHYGDMPWLTLVEYPNPLTAAI